MSVLRMASFTMIQSRHWLEEYFRLQYYIFVLKTTMFLFWHVSSKPVSSLKKQVIRYCKARNKDFTINFLQFRQ